MLLVPWLVLFYLVAVRQCEGIPKGFSTFFRTASCPSGWQVVSAAQGRLVLATDHAESAGSTVLGPLGDRREPVHSHSINAEFTFASHPTLGSGGLGGSSGARRGSYKASVETSIEPSGLPFAQLQLCELLDANSVPLASGVVAFFNSSSAECPDGWEVMTKLKGRFIVPGYDAHTKFDSPASSEDAHDHGFETFVDPTEFSYATVVFVNTNNEPAFHKNCSISGTSSSSTLNLPHLSMLSCGFDLDGSSRIMRLPPSALVFFATECPHSWFAALEFAGRLVVAMPQGGLPAALFGGNRTLPCDNTSSLPAHRHSFASTVQLASQQILLAAYDSPGGYAKAGSYAFGGVTSSGAPRVPYSTLPFCEYRIPTSTLSPMKSPTMALSNSKPRTASITVNAMSTCSRWPTASPSSSRIASRSKALTANSKTMSLPDAPKPSTNNGAVKVLSEIISEDAGKAVVVSSSAAGGVSAILSTPTSASVAMRTAFVAGAAQCQYDENNLEPDWLQYPVVFSVVDTPNGAERSFSKHAGGVVSICAIAVLMCLLRVAFGKSEIGDEGAAHTIRERALAVLCALEAMFLQYYLPSAALGAVVVARYSSRTETIVVTECGFAFVAGVALSRFCSVLCAKVKFSLEPDSRSGTVKGQWSGGMVLTHGAYFTGSRDFRASIRVVYFAELLCSVLMGCAGGWHPSGSSSCIGIAVWIAFCAVFLFIYLAVLHPYERKIEMTISLMFSGAQVLQTFCLVGVVVLDSAFVRAALSWVTLVLSWGIVAQLGVVLLWECAHKSRSNFVTDKNKEGGGCVNTSLASMLTSAAGDDSGDAPIELSVNPLTATSTADQEIPSNDV